jgi:hypothetical protein
MTYDEREGIWADGVPLEAGSHGRGSGDSKSFRPEGEPALMFYEGTGATAVGMGDRCADAGTVGQPVLRTDLSGGAGQTGPACPP